MIKMIRSILMMVCLVVSVSVNANNPIVEKLHQLCLPYQVANTLNLEIEFYHTNTEGVRSLSEQVLIKRNHNHLYVNQKEMTVVINESDFIQVDKLKKKVILSKSDTTIAKNIFSSFDPNAFLEHAIEIEEDESYKKGTLFLVHFSMSSPYKYEKIYFDEKGNIKKIVLAKESVDVMTSKVNRELLEIVYVTSSVTPKLSTVDFSSEQIFTNRSKLQLRESYANFEFINRQNQ